jgi:fatty-acid desaturase
MSDRPEMVLTKLATADMAAADVPTGTTTADGSTPVWHARLGADGKLPKPATVDGKAIVWDYAISFVVFHAVACLAFFPYFFSWTGVVIAVLGFYVFGTLGINLCYHRLLTHQGFVVPKWLERTFATLGVLCVQDTPAKWVAIHRLHHQYSDEQPDPHSPLVDLFWGHMGWLLVDNKQIHSLNHYEKYARDVLRDPYYFALERKLAWVWLNLGSWVLFFGAGFGIGYGQTGTLAGATQFGWSLLIWGVFVRTVAVWHITWSVNSLAHVWGYRNYETDENSRNNWFVGLVSNGEGWHNNHHADQRSAQHGHRWWEFDLTWSTIHLLELLGLAKQVVRPSRRLVDMKP